MPKIFTFKSPRFLGKPLKYCLPFNNYLVKIDEIAKEMRIKIYITSSYRTSETQLNGAIVTPSKMSNHWVGCAFDCNLYDSKGVLHNSKLLEFPKGEIKEFIERVEAIGVRWGGRFQKKDVVHFDYPLNIKNKAEYEKILSE